jgi:hypothetical protein
MKQTVGLSTLVLLLSIIALGCDAPQPVAKVGGAASAPPPPPAPPLPPGSQPPAPAIANPPAEAVPTPAEAAASPRPAALPIETKAGVFAGSLDDLAAGPGSSSSPAPTPPPKAAAPPPKTEIVKAEKGVGLKGRSLDEYEGYAVTPVKALFAAKERIAFEIEVPHALALYDATNGGPPKTHEEFMKNVIEANKIKLPVLPDGQEYLYDPERNELMVKRPVKR